jgi:hypothetical protein
MPGTYRVAIRYRCGFGNWRITMKIAIYAVATIACLAGAPGVAGAATGGDRPITLAQYVERDFDRPRWREPGWRHRHEGCREVTIRERRGGEMIVRHIRRCD